MATALNDLEVSALNALAASGGTMTFPDFVAVLETRQGSTDERAGDARSLESRSFEQAVRDMISADRSGSLLERGLVSATEAGAMVTITQAGRDAIGRGVVIRATRVRAPGLSNDPASPPSGADRPLS